VTEIYLSPEDLAQAFPIAFRNDAFTAGAAFPTTRSSGSGFTARISNEIVTIPNRLYNDPSHIHTGLLTVRQRELVDGLLTRHSDGFVRERALARIIKLNRGWVPPFVVQLASEYVIEILRLIEQNIGSLDRELYASFIRENPEILQLTKQRIISYWDCYYRNETRGLYAGFKILDFLQSLQRTA
jgi:hypothetical protein